MLDDLTRPPADDRSFFSDWGDPREYSLGDMGVGECAGEVVSPFDFEMAVAERELFEGQLALEAGSFEEAGQKAYRAMLLGAKALVKIQNVSISDDPEEIVSEFRARFFETRLFWDPFAGGKFAQYFLDAHEQAGQPYDADRSRYLLDEAQLFIDAAHSCNHRMMTTVSV
jgi:sulfite reductase (ferredoxin)